MPLFVTVVVDRHRLKNGIFPALIFARLTHWKCDPNDTGRSQPSNNGCANRQREKSKFFSGAEINGMATSSAETYFFFVRLVFCIFRMAWNTIYKKIMSHHSLSYHLRIRCVFLFVYLMLMRLSYSLQINHESETQYTEMTETRTRLKTTRATTMAEVINSIQFCSFLIFWQTMSCRKHLRLPHIIHILRHCCFDSEWTLFAYTSASAPPSTPAIYIVFFPNH